MTDLAVQRRPADRDNAGAVTDEGPPLVLVHGAMDRASSFSRTVRRLRAYDVTTYDRRGYAGSIDAGPACDLERHAADLIEIIGHTPSAVVGHSYGGLIALAAASEHPTQIPVVAAYEPPSPFLDWWPGSPAESEPPEDAAERFFASMVGDDAWARLPEKTRALRRREGPAYLKDVRSSQEFDASALADLVVPTTLAHGSRSDATYVRAATELSEMFGAELKVIAGAAHGAHLSHPDAFAEFVATIIREGQLPLAVGSAND